MLFESSDANVSVVIVDRRLSSALELILHPTPSPPPLFPSRTQQTAAAIRESLRATSGYLSPRGLAPDRWRTGGSSLGGGGGGGGRRDASSAAGGSLSGGAPPAAPPGFVAPLDDLQALSDMLRSSYFNLLLVCVPLGWAASSLRWGAVPVFALNFTSLIPLALVLGQITEDLALRYGEEGERAGWGGGGGSPLLLRSAASSPEKRQEAFLPLALCLFPPLDFSSFRPLSSKKKKTYRPPPPKGDTIGGLINATFGNVVEMILTVSALRRGLYQVVSFSLVGSILSNMLMVLGFCYLVGGLIYAEQRFSTLANKAFCSLLFMACIALLVPTSVSIFYDDRVMPPSSVLALSRATAVVMLCIYGAYLYFTLGTHSAMVVEDARVSALATRASSTAVAIGGGARSGGAEEEEGEEEAKEEEGEEEVPQVSLLGATLSLSLLTAVIAVASEALTGSIETVTARTGISTAFISVIILPIAGNAAEHLTAVVVAAKGKMDLAQSIALGSSLQISMLALPFAVLAAW